METPYLDSQLNGYRQLAESGKMPESGMEQLRELEAIKEALSIHSVNHQRKLLKDYSDFLKSDESKYYSEEFGIEEFLEAFNCA